MRTSPKRYVFLERLADRADDLVADGMAGLLLMAMLVFAGLLSCLVGESEPHRWIWLTTVTAPAYDNIAGFGRDATGG